MTRIYENHSETIGVSGRSARRSGRRAGMLALGLAMSAAACSDSVVPYFQAPTSIPNSPAGIQNGVVGLFSGSRNDVSNYVFWNGAFGRDLGYFVTSAPPVLTVPGGLTPVAPGNFNFVDGWTNEYAMIRQANAIFTNVAKVSSYSAAQIAAVQGMVQTIKAYDYMLLAETRDTIGIPLYAVSGNPSDPPYCNKDVWQYIVAVLDSGFAELNAAGNIPLPVKLPVGYTAVSAVAAPSTQLGSFASFNRALAGKAGLQYAYAIARNSAGTHPTPTTAGAPDVAALTRADSAITASALYDTTFIAPPAAGPFAIDAHGVYHNFSGSSGDIQNGIFIAYYNYDTFFDFQYDVDTLNDKRWLNKFVADPFPVQVAQYAGVSSAKNYLPYSQVNAPIPIVRVEELELVRAQIQLGLGNFANAITMINHVHQKAGGFASPLNIAANYPAVRDTLLKEQRISTVFEGSGDRMIALRMYHLEAVADTTWQATGAGPDAPVVTALGNPTDYHTTVSSYPPPEAAQRGGYTLTCP